MSKVLGLDVGASAIKAVLMEDTFQGPRIRQFFHFPYPQMSRQEAIEAFFEKNPVQAHRLVVSLKGYEGSVRIVEFPFSDARKVKSVLPFELESEFADGVDSRDFRFHPILTSLRTKETDSYRYLSIGVRKQVVQEFVEGFRKAGFRPHLVDYDAYANFNCFYKSEQKPNAGLSLLIDVGAKSTGINIMTPTELLYTRSVFFGGNDFTQAVAEALNLEFSQAEEIKIEYGLHGGEADSKVTGALRDCVDYLIREIRLTLGSFYALQGHQEIQGIYLFGGGATLKGFSESLSRILEVPVEEGNPVRSLNVSVEPPHSPLLYSIAIGLAMRGLGRGELCHNFLERSLMFDSMTQRRVVQHAAAVCLGLGLWVMTSTLEWGIGFYHLNALRQSYQDETQAILKKQQGAYRDLATLHQKIRERKRMLERFAISYKSPLWFVDYLSQNLGTMDAIIEELTLENRDDGSHIVVKGTVPGGADLGGFEKILDNCPGVVTRTRVNSGTDPITGRYMFEEKLDFKERRL